MPIACLGRKVVLPVAGRASAKRQPEAQRGLGAQLEEGVERQDDDEARRADGRQVRKPEAMLSARSAPQSVPDAINGRSRREARKSRQHDGHGEIAGRVGRRAEFEGVRLERGCPEERGAIGG